MQHSPSHHGSSHEAEFGSQDTLIHDFEHKAAAQHNAAPLPPLPTSSSTPAHSTPVEQVQLRGSTPSAEPSALAQDQGGEKGGHPWHVTRQRCGAFWSECCYDAYFYLWTAYDALLRWCACGDKHRKRPRRRGQEEKERTVYMNRHERNAEYQHMSNFVRTTQYTLITFLPKNLYQQLGKAANFYFLVLAILVSIPGVSDIQAYTSIVPLVFVLAVSALREALEDYSRYKDDVEVNSRKTHVIRGGSLLPVQWKDVVVGDIVKVYTNEYFPTDLVCLSSAFQTGECHIETSNLDGESALKQRQSLRQTNTIHSIEEFAALNSIVRCELPSSNLHYFEGVYCAEADGEKKEYPVTIEELLPRGAALMNTEYIYGLAIYTGAETKIFMNLNEPKHKRTNVEIVTNHQMYKIFIILFWLCFFMAIVFGATTQNRIHRDWYLGFDRPVTDSYVNSSTGDFFVRGIRDWAAFLVLYSQMVPISLYVSVELVRVAQSFIINWDIEMYDERTNTRAIARTAALNEQLGEIKQVFCDKTGTLTENQMAFAKCSIAGVAYGGNTKVAQNKEAEEKKKEAEKKNKEAEEKISDEIDESVREELEDIKHHNEFERQQTAFRPANKLSFPEFRLEDPELFKAVKKPSDEIHDYFVALAVCHTVQIITAAEEEKRAMEEKKERDEAEQTFRRLQTLHDPAVNPAGEAPLEMPQMTSRPNLAHAPSLDHMKIEPKFSRENSISRNAPSRSTADFSYGDVAYQSSSPDEMALVVAARVLGYYFHTRERDRIRIATPRGELAFEILHVIEFTSERKRMSVVARCPDGKTRVFTKGADSVILQNLKRDPTLNPPHILKKTNEHLSMFSQEGLRVMAVASVELDTDFFKEWDKRYREASKAIGNRKEQMDKIAPEVESDLRLLGVTAIEDKLQEGVPDTIRRLRQAGIRVWILTGDKQETAVNIGKSCSLIENMDVQYLSTGTDSPTAPAAGSKRDSVFVVQNLEPQQMNLINSLPPELRNRKGNRAFSDPSQLQSTSEDEKAYMTRASSMVEHSSLQQTSDEGHPEESAEVHKDHKSPSLKALDAAPVPPLKRQLTAKEVYAMKVQEAIEESSDREAEVKHNLEYLLERFDARQESETKRLAALSPDLLDTIPSSESAEQRKARTGSALIVDGPTLGYALSAANEPLFLRIIKHPQCRVVVCARLAPKQKAQVVELVKIKIGDITLAIGDGANDVSMIQAAHVGVGISGVEGRQAVNSSDYAFAQYRFLGRLLLVHGRWSYTRNTMLVLYMFYKNIAIAWTQFWWTLTAAYSDQEIYDGVLLNTFNLFFTSLPILFLSVLDRDLEPQDLMAYPEVYRDKDDFSVKRFWSWVLLGFIHSIVVFFIPFYSIYSSSTNDSFWSGSFAVYTALVLAVTVKLMVVHNSFTLWNWFILFISVAFYFVIASLYNSVPLREFGPFTFDAFFKMCEEPYVWFALILCCLLAFLPDFIMRYVQRQFYPSPRVIIQECRAFGLPLPQRPVPLSEEQAQQQQPRVLKLDVATEPLNRTDKGAQSPSLHAIELQPVDK